MIRYGSWPPDTSMQGGLCENLAIDGQEQSPKRTGVRLLEVLVSFPFVLVFLMVVFLPSIALWNVRGAGRKSFSSLVRDLSSRHKIDLLLLLELRISGQRVMKVVRSLGFQKKNL